MKLFGRLKAEKVGSLPPVSVVCQPLLLKFLFPMLRFLRSLGGERVKTLVQARLQSEFLTFFTGDVSLGRARFCGGRASDIRRADKKDAAASLMWPPFGPTWLPLPHFVPVG
jgi:hypothetical protein